MEFEEQQNNVSDFFDLENIVLEDEFTSKPSENAEQSQIQQVSFK